MNLKLIATTLAFVLAIGAITACGEASTPTVEPVAEASAAEQPQVVSAEAFVVPLKKSDLSFEIGGRVATIKVEEGDKVAKGDVLAQLDQTSYQTQVAAAQAGLIEAEANLAKAQADLANTKAPVTQEKIAQAEAALAKAQAALAEQIAGPTEEAINVAKAEVAVAQASLNEVLAGSRDEDLQAASAKMLQAEAEVRLAQADYDRFVYGDPKVAEPYGVALQKATLTYEAAKAEYDKLVNGATGEAIAVARAGVAKAQAALAQAMAGATPEQIAQAQADVASAEAALADVKTGATAEEIAVAEAGVKIAEAGVESAKTGITSAQAELAKTELIAPFAGTIGELNLDEGEIVQPGTVALSLGDSSKWQIETDDLTEIDVVNVREGARVSISVDALPGEEFDGKVVRITPKSVTKAGDVTYTVLIDITSGDVSRLRWGMTTFVDIEIGPEL
ncbi:MAG: efflux RND transporter periplasmic adaptor subunit [Anaerolineales bacterium]|nr:efflux RND transporter periplasmic adaptor subunit [Anaerolineales bacterium]